MKAILPRSSAEMESAQSGGCVPSATRSHRDNERLCGNSKVLLPKGLSCFAPGLSRRAALAAAAGFFCSVALADTPMRLSDEQPVAWGNTHRLIAIARRDLGKSGPQMGLPSRLWCGFAMNIWRKRAGLSAPKSGLAFDHARYGKRISRPVIGALLVQGRRGGGGHVSIITEIHSNGTVTAISGNDGRRVRERVRSARGLILLPH